MGWPEPVVGDSGNGAQLRYATNLPANEATTQHIKRLLVAANKILPDQFKDKVKVDSATHDLPRIAKVLGTTTRKEEGTPDRPHRRSRVISAPEKLEIVQIDSIIKLIKSGVNGCEDGIGDDVRTSPIGHQRPPERTKLFADIKNDHDVRPCLKEIVLNDDIRRLEEVGVKDEQRGRVALATELMTAGYTDNALHDFFKRLEDYKVEKTEYQINHIQRTWIEPGKPRWLCETLRDKGIILAGRCENCKWPSYDKESTISEEELLKIKIPENPRFKTNLESNNFIQEYIRYGETVSDGYIDYWFAGLFCLSVAVNRNAVIKLRQGPIYPNVWLNFLGLSSLSRKSTATDKTDSTITAANIDTECKVPDEFSPEAMIERLDQHPRAYMIKDESAGLLAVMKKDYMRGLKDALMQLFDGKDINRELRTSRRRSDRTTFRVRDPYLCMMLATTPGSFAANTELLDVTSGWLPRFLHFFPNHAKENWLPLEEGVPENDILSAVCHARLIKVRQFFYDRSEPKLMHLSKEADIYFKAWQKVRERELVEAKDDRRALFYSRLAVYVLKLGMLFTIGRADFSEDLEISLNHIREACRLADKYFMPMAMRVADLVGKAADKNNLDKVVSVLTSQGGKIKKRELGRKTHLIARDLDETLESLKTFEEIEVVTVSNPHGEPTIWVILSQDSESNTFSHTVTTVKDDILSHQKKNKNDVDSEKPRDGSDTMTLMTECDKMLMGAESDEGCNL